MEDQKQTSFTFKIDNFSDKEGAISSSTFSCGGCEWYVDVYPKGSYNVDDHVSMYLQVANPESLRLGWKRRASYSFVLLNQSGIELFRKDESLCQLFCAQFSGRGLVKAVPLKKLQEKGFLEKNKLIVKVEVKVVEAIDQGKATGNETFVYNGFHVRYTQVSSVSRLFVEHPDIAVNFRPICYSVKTTYMNLLLNLIETLNKPPHSFTETELSNAHSELIKLTEAGFKLDWLKTKLAEVTLERKKSNSDDDDTQFQELEEQNKNVKVELNKGKRKSSAKVLSLEQIRTEKPTKRFCSRDMEDQEETSFTFEIDNFSDKEAVISSPTFSSGGCEWYVDVYPKGSYNVDDHVSMYLQVANPKSLRLGWKRRADYSVVLLNQSGQELFKINDSSCQLFCAQFSGRGIANAVPLKKLKEEGFLEKNKLIVKVEVKVVEVVDQGKATRNETIDYNGFHVLNSQVYSVSRLFVEHPDIAENLRFKNQVLKTTCMNILLGLIQTLDKPPHSISETELSDAHSQLIELTEAGFKLDWLKTKLAEVTLERKKSNSDDDTQVQELEEQNKNSASPKGFSFKNVVYFWNTKK
ncbi:unnamed protein product [Microthlaspi erraticum]|uniref:MATH domain-containing protein n=1 Tax=Microthlaspi erraticum TaxID=1685480 RepID=A0A6D2KNG7_9BRAS|nr:unnamed protein product [Microthlaspi erraticum]CAA7056072.1 unnamed protein product [Microthlaspi erraticum]